MRLACRAMTEQAKKFGAERVSDNIKSVDLTGPVKKLVGARNTYEAHCVIIATGAFPRPIGCKNEGKFVGKGISFCATCDAAFFEDFEVYVVGGGDAAVEEAMIKNAVYGIITAKASGIARPTVGILNVDGARQTEMALNQLRDGGYDFDWATSARADGGAVMKEH